MERYLDNHIREDLKEKIILISRPRQVGKTTLSVQLEQSHVYLNKSKIANSQKNRLD